MYGLRFLVLPGYLATANRLSRCYGPRHAPNFTAVRASDGLDSVQHLTFKPFR